MEPTRSKTTEHAYLRRALWMEESVARELGMANPSPIDVVSFAIASRESWSKSNWRQIKASLIYRYTEMGTEQAIKAAQMIASHSQSACLKRSSKTSAQRLKNVGENDLEQILVAIRGSSSKYASVLETWLQLGARFGLRPHEWCQAQVVWMRPSLVELMEQDQGDEESSQFIEGNVWVQGSEDGFSSSPINPSLDPPTYPTTNDDDPCWHLRVTNSKTTNGRSHGPYRHLNLVDCDLRSIRQAAEFSHLMANVKANDLYETYYESCKRLLYRLNVRLGKGGRKHIQLYSSRHIFTSNAKARYTVGEVGALMGHATDRTATSHYGKRRHGVTGGDWVKPSQAEVKKVVRRLRPFPGDHISPKSGSRAK